MDIIKVKNLKKHFGKTKAVDGISFDVKRGEIFGFLGPNGAGKTTTIRCMMDFLRPNSGNISISGLDAHKDSVVLKQKIGYLSGDKNFYNWKTKEHINFFAALRGDKDSKKLIKELDLDLEKRAGQLSSGNKQKLGLVLALMSKPEVMIMDEPTVGLDPILQNTVYKILHKLSASGTTIFMSSHNLPEVERVCSKVAIIKNGKIVGIEDIVNLESKRIHTINVYFDEDYDRNDLKMEGVEIMQHMDHEGVVLKVKGDINPVLKKLTEYKLRDIEIGHATLEEVFLEFYKK